MDQDPSSCLQSIQDEAGGELEGGVTEGGLVDQDVHQALEPGSPEPGGGHDVRDAQGVDDIGVAGLLHPAQVQSPLYDHGGLPRDATSDVTCWRMIDLFLLLSKLL